MSAPSTTRTETAVADEQDLIRRTLDEHWFYDDTNACECGYWAHFDSVRRHHIEDMLVAALSVPLGCTCSRSTESDAVCPVHVAPTMTCGDTEPHEPHRKVGDGRPCGGVTTPEEQVQALIEGDAALIRMTRNDALRRAADALEAQPPKLKAQYVAVLRLYADEPERLGLAATPRAREIRCASCASPLPDDGECRTCDDDSEALINLAAPATCCGHIHTPHGCTGEPTPSDRWAGVTPAACDCDVVIPPGQATTS